MPVKHTIGGLLAFIVVSASVTFGLLHGAHTQAATPVEVPAHLPIANPVGPGPNAAIMYSPGVTAIHPSIVGAQAGAIAITAADVERYIAQGNLVQSAIPSAKPRIAKLLFLSAGQVRKMLGGEWIGRPDSAPVIFVEVRGTFKTGFTPVPRGVTVPATVPQAMAVFDAHTGNLLLSN